MATIDYRVASPADEQRLAAMLRDAPMDGWVRMQLLREPSYFAADALYGKAVTILAQSGEETAGMCRLQFLPVWVNGKSVEAGYLAGLRVAARFRHRLSLLRKGFTTLRAACYPEEAQPICFTSIASDNIQALRLLEANLARMPVYSPLAPIQTLAISTRQGKPGRALRQATVADIPAIVAFHRSQAAYWQFAPCLTEDWLAKLDHSQALAIDDFWLHEEQGRLCACLALWDQRRLKQTVAHGYRAPLNLLRKVYNGYARLNGRICLPAPGETLNQAYLAFFASNLETNESIALIREALWRLRQRDIAVGVIGLAMGNPLREPLRRALSATTYETRIDSVCFSGDTAIALDGRPPQPEVAVL